MPFTELSENYERLQNGKYTWPATDPNKDLRVKNYKNMTKQSLSANIRGRCSQNYGFTNIDVYKYTKLHTKT